jgi:two-component system KDP operon response regulator KdpE
MAANKPKILVVDDEPQIRRFLRAGLTTQGYELIEAVNGEEALARTAAEHPDLVILDLGLPDTDGNDVIASLREWTAVPIIVLSVRSAEGDKIKALDAGADDFLTKPFSVGELLARIRTALRHVAITDSGQPEFTLGRLKVDFIKRLVTLDGAEVHLSRKEYEILRLLISHAGRVLTHQHLLREIWGQNFVEQTQYLRVYIGQLRQKLERDPTQPEFLLTEPGVGYRLKLPSE